MGMCICTCTCVRTSAHFPPMSFSLVTNAMLQKAKGTTTTHSSSRSIGAES